MKKLPKKPAVKNTPVPVVPSISNIAGMVTALAVTPAGGVTTRVECLLLSGRGRLILTGRLIGEAKDSCQVAVSLARSRAPALGISPSEFMRTDVHFHVPEGLPSKDGPSAGLAMFVALVSAMTREPVNSKLAFTGEITLSGKIEAISGLSEKAAAAVKAGVTHIYAPRENLSEAGSFSKKAKKNLTLVAADDIDSVLALVFKKTFKKTKGHSPASRTV